MSKKLYSIIIANLIVLLAPSVAFAHVIVTPNQADVAQELVFNVSVPNERLDPVSSVKLLIPNGVSDVLPTSKDGWAITTTSSSTSQGDEVTSILWTGNIPVGQRQDFSFGAQVPGQATELDWKAYQTYADGTVVHWDQKPAGSDDATGDAGPYSVTKVINDLTSKQTNGTSMNSQVGPYAVAFVALFVALAALLTGNKKRNR
jgi:uncharacterized protein YcnI